MDNLSRRSLLKGLFGLAVLAAVGPLKYLPAPVSVPFAEKFDAGDPVPRWAPVEDGETFLLTPGRIMRYKGEILARAVPIEVLADRSYGWFVDED